MKIGILPIGQVATSITHRIKEDLMLVFPYTTCMVIDWQMPLPEKAFDKKREQYHSDAILSEIQGYAAEKEDLNRVLGIVDAEIFVPELNFVFGEAVCPGKAALVSLWRLKPEFYVAPANMELFSGKGSERGCT